MGDREAILKILERGQSMWVTDKFAKHIVDMERAASLKATQVLFKGISLGETLDRIEFPLYWRRLLKRKDCPKYMRKISQVDINAYYPKLSLPKEKHWLTFDYSGLKELEGVENEQ